MKNCIHLTKKQYSEHIKNSTISTNSAQFSLKLASSKQAFMKRWQIANTYTKKKFNITNYVGNANK